MQRSQSLIPLSHDHHHGLAWSRRIRQSLSKPDVTELSRGLIQFRDRELNRHFEEEEKFIFPLMPAADENIRRALDEHRQLREMMDEIDDEARRLCQTDEAGILSQTRLRQLLEDFAGLLHDHIRFEERVLFPEIERQLPPDILAAAAQFLNH